MGLRGFWTKGNARAHGEARIIEAVGEQVQRWIGPIQGVFHEENSTEVHVDVHWVAPDEERPFHTLVTSGASQRAMRPPAGAEPCTHLELVMFLPPSWNLAEPSEGERWPILALRALARYPHKQRTWLWGGHTVPLGYSHAAPFTAAVLTRPYLLNPKVGQLHLTEGPHIEFFSLIPLYPQELAYILEHDARSLIKVAEASDQLDDLLIVTKGRPSLT